MEKIINQIAKHLIKVTIEESCEGNWTFDFDRIEKDFNIKLTDEVLKEIEEILLTSEEVADVQIYDNIIDILVWLYLVEG